MAGDISSKILVKNLQYQVDYRSQKSVVFIIVFLILMITASLPDGYALLDAFHHSNYQEIGNILLELIVFSACFITMFLANLPSLNIVNDWLPKKKTVYLQPNQGIRDSFGRFLAQIIPALLLIIIGPLQSEFDDGIFTPWTILGFSTFSGLMNGGMACAKHFSMRLVLCAIAKVIPWNYARFLDYCVERRLLQRIGGRYRFLHRELLEHFVDKAGGVS